MTSKRDELARFRELGRQAFLAGKPRIPALSAEVMAACEGLPVGGGAADIMRAFIAGWDAANLADATDEWLSKIVRSKQDERSSKRRPHGRQET